MEGSFTSQEEIQQLGHTTDNYASLYHSCYDNYISLVIIKLLTIIKLVWF